MAFDRNIFYIEERKLAEALGITLRELDEIVKSLLTGQDERTQLKRFLHFVVQGRINQQYEIRTFSREGAIAIASHKDLQDTTTEATLQKVFTLLKQYHINQIDSKVRRKIHANSSSLVRRNERHWLSDKDIASIFDADNAQLFQAFRNIQRSDFPMRINEDFENYGTTRFFSLSGLEKLSIEFSLTEQSEERREYCERVREVAPPVLKFLSLLPSPSQEKIDQAMRSAKRRDDNTCQITGLSRDKYENRSVEIVVHHLYDKNTYRFLADEPYNLLSIAKQESEDFHQWNGGNDKTCTINEFIEYVERHYPEKHDVLLMLLNRRSVLMLRLAQLQRALPASEE